MKAITLGKLQILKIIGTEKRKIAFLLNRFAFIEKIFSDDGIIYKFDLFFFSFKITKPYKTDYDRLYAKRFSDQSQAYLESIVAKQHEHYHGKPLNLESPKSFSEKLNWLKVFYHDPVTTVCADKCRVQEYVKSKVGKIVDHLIPQYGQFASADELDFAALPDRFALKSNWGSGQQILVRDKTNLDPKVIKRELACWLLPEANHYYCAFEFGYKDIKPLILCEKLLDFDYKLEIFCFNGYPRYYWTIFDDKTKDVHADFYDILGKKLPLRHKYPNTERSLPQPPDFAEMLEVAKTLSADFPFVRIDFYKTATSWYFSEMTFCHWAGLMPMTPASYDLEFGSWLQLPEKKI